MTGAKVVTGEDGLARCPWGATDQLLRDYHDSEWGVPVAGEQALFERIMMEAFQAGQSWRIVLAKREGFRAAFANFDPDEVAALTDEDLERLAGDAAIVRNRQKIAATRTNALATIALRDHESGGLEKFVAAHRPAESPAPRTTADVPTSSDDSKALAKALRKQGFVFVGPTGMYALMEAIGMVDTHLTGCFRRGVAGTAGA
jgi:DNA-3-methyladenine glycosylase I